MNKAHEQSYEMKLLGVRQGDGTFIPDLHETCTWCGSLSVDGVLKAFQTPGTQYSGSDWKYGWPHKFYIEIPCEPYRHIISSHYDGKGSTTHEYGMSSSRHHKFYAVHLQDATPEQLEQWNQIAGPLVGVRFEMSPVFGTLRFITPCHGYQTHGVVSGCKIEVQRKSILTECVDIPATTEELYQAIQDIQDAERILNTHGRCFFFFL